ncbi:hypothetical protein ACTXT7_001232 [Hymenolepis weldensis]
MVELSYESGWLKFVLHINANIGNAFRQYGTGDAVINELFSEVERDSCRCIANARSGQPHLLINGVAELKVLIKGDTIVAFDWLTVQLAHKGTLITLKRRNWRTEDSYDYSGQFKPQQSSIFRSLLGITGIAGGAVLVLYLSPQARDYVTQTAPQLKPCINSMNEVLNDWKKKASSFDMSSFTPFKFPTKNDEVQPNSFNRRVSVSPEDTGVGPTFPSTLDATHIVGDVKQPIQDIESEIKTAISHTEKAVSDALADLRALHSVTGRQLNDQQSTLGKFELPDFLNDKLGRAERKAKESHQNAQKQLAKLRTLLDSAKESMSEKEKELVKSAIVRYSDLAYDLSGLVTELSVHFIDKSVSVRRPSSQENVQNLGGFLFFPKNVLFFTNAIHNLLVRRLQNQSSVYLNLTKADNEGKIKLQEELDAILPKSLSKLRKGMLSFQYMIKKQRTGWVGKS